MQGWYRTAVNFGGALDADSARKEIEKRLGVDGSDPEIRKQIDALISEQGRVGPLGEDFIISAVNNVFGMFEDVLGGRPMSGFDDLASRRLPTIPKGLMQDIV